MRNHIAFLITIVILATACARESETTIETGTVSSETAVTPTATEPTATAATGTTATTPASGNEIHVRLSEYRIEMPDSLSAGPTTFHVMNEGKEKHSFEIEGEGIERELTSELDAGTTGTLQVDLSAGTYRVYCPVGDHATKHAMSRQIKVR